VRPQLKNKNKVIVKLIATWIKRIEPLQLFIIISVILQMNLEERALPQKLVGYSQYCSVAEEHNSSNT
jgi:hypothetical protein